jgi:hypothetical protein
LEVVYPDLRGLMHVPPRFGEKRRHVAPSTVGFLFKEGLASPFSSRLPEQYATGRTRPSFVIQMLVAPAQAHLSLVLTDRRGFSGGSARSL